MTLALTRHSAICLLLLLSSQWSLAQSNLRFQGKVIDEKTQEPLSFAHLIVKGKYFGTTTNNSGVFVLSLEQTYLQDSLLISYLGYRSITVPIAKLQRSGNILSLAEESAALTEVVVISPTTPPVEIVRKALQNIPYNYLQEPKNSLGFFRESISVEEGDLLEEILFAEGVLEFYKTPYNRPNSARNAVRIVKGNRKNLFYGYEHETDTLLLPPISQGPHLGLLMDIVKTKPPYFSNSQLRQYEFEHLGYTNLDTSRLHIIGFKPTAKNKNISFEGKLYIEHRYYALAKAEVYLSKRSLNLHNRQIQAEFGIPMSLLSRKLEVDYAKFSDVWHFQSSRVQNHYKDQRTNFPIHNKMEVIITEYKKEKAGRFPEQDQLERESVFATQAGQLDSNYWGGFNVLAEEKPIHVNTAAPLTEWSPSWQYTLKEARKIAQHQHQFMLVDFWSLDCDLCITVDIEVWGSETIAKLTEGFVQVRINTDEDKGTPYEYWVETLPALLLMDPWGDVYHRFKGLISQEELVEVLETYQTDLRDIYEAQEQVKRNPTNPYGYFQLGHAYQQQAFGLRDKALSTFLMKADKYLSRAQGLVNRQKDQVLSQKIKIARIANTILRGRTARALRNLEKMEDGKAIEGENQALFYFLSTVAYQRAGNPSAEAKYYDKLLSSKGNDLYVTLLHRQK